MAASDYPVRRAHSDDESALCEKIGILEEMLLIAEAHGWWVARSHLYTLLIELRDRLDTVRLSKTSATR